MAESSRAPAPRPGHRSSRPPATYSRRALPTRGRRFAARTVNSPDRVTRAHPARGDARRHEKRARGLRWLLGCAAGTRACFRSCPSRRRHDRRQRHARARRERQDGAARDFGKRRYSTTREAIWPAAGSRRACSPRSAATRRMRSWRLRTTVGDDVLVVARRRGPSSHVLGSTSSHIVRSANCDVLMVHDVSSGQGNGGVLRVRQGTKCLAALLVLRGRPASVSRTTQEPTEPVHCDRITKTT
jgi:hypothetical protein